MTEFFQTFGKTKTNYVRIHTGRNTETFPLGVQGDKIKKGPALLPFPA